MVELNPFLGMIVITHDIGNKTYLWTESYVFFVFSRSLYLSHQHASYN